MAAAKWRQVPALPVHTIARPARQPGEHRRSASAHGLLTRLPTASLVGGIEGGAGAVEGAGDEVAVDLVGDLDALVAFSGVSGVRHGH